MLSSAIHASLLGCALTVLSSAASAAPHTVPFDSAIFDSPTASFSPDALRKFGMVANTDYTLCNVELIQPDAYDQYLAAGGTPPAALILSTTVGQLTLDMRFVVPDTDLAATTNSVSLLFFDTNVGTMAGWVEAYDVFGTLLGRAEAMTPASMLTTLTVSAEGIHMIRVGTDGDGAIVDNFVTSTLVAVAVPAPGAIGLLAGLLVGQGRRRRA